MPSRKDLSEVSQRETWQWWSYLPKKLPRASNYPPPTTSTESTDATTPRAPPSTLISDVGEVEDQHDDEPPVTYDVEESEDPELTQVASRIVSRTLKRGAEELLNAEKEVLGLGQQRMGSMAPINFQQFEVVRERCNACGAGEKSVRTVWLTKSHRRDRQGTDPQDPLPDEEQAQKDSCQEDDEQAQ